MPHITPEQPLPLSESEYHALVRQDAGLCLDCGSTETLGVEPDAEGYECEECGAGAVQGLENALCDGNIAIQEEVD